MKTLRIFISSPGDVRLERVRAFEVISRLQTKFRAFLKLEPILWEHDVQSGWATFQANIVPPSKTDIVICILWARIGMRLPEDYKREDGSVPTGTEWEFEDAYAGYKLNGTPDLYVYRKTANPTIEVTSEESLEEWRRQKRALDLFFERWFRDHEGAFKAGFNTFKRDDEFGKMLEQHLEKVINQRIQQEEGYSAEEERKVTWFEGSPFRGLSAFQPEHAPVFFGRDLEIREITDRLMAQSGAGKVFLMILGMSGCGKSSLVRAGVLPVLLQPGAVPGVDCWRWLILRPSEVQDDLVEGLAQGLLSSQALPELELLGYNPQQLLALLSEVPAHAIPLLDAAQRLAGRQAGAERMLSGTLTCRLLVIVDQLEEMFTLERFDSGQRRRFITALGALCRSGLAWIVTTMRSDLYARCGEVEELLGLKGQDGQYDLRPPGFAEVGQMIRLPARAAGLRFELEPKSGKALDDALHEEAWKNPEALPLLEFTLEQLYRAKGDSNLLSWRAYRSLGGMQGAIARRAEEVYESLSEQGKSALASVFSLLVSISEKEGASGKPAPLGEFKLRPGAEEVVQSFAKASLLLSDVDAHGTSVVSLAHEALLRSWPRLQEWLQQNYEFLKVKERVATATQRWIDEHGAEAYLLPEGKPLVEAEELLDRHPETLSGKEMEFIRASIASEQMRRQQEAIRRRKALTTISGALVVAIIFGVISFWQYQKATISARAADDTRDQADGLINFMLYDLRDKLEPIGRLDVLDDVAKKAKEYLEGLPKELVTGSRLDQQVNMLDNLGDVRVAQGKLQDALGAYRQSLTISKRLAERDKSNSGWQRDLTVSYSKVGDVLKAQGKLQDALDAYQQSLAISKRLAEQDKSDSPRQRDLSVIYERIGDVLEAQGKLQDGLDEYQQSLKIRQTLGEQDKSNSVCQRDLTVSYERVGDVLKQQGKLPEALDAYQQSLAISKRLFEQDKSNSSWQNDLSWRYSKVGDVLVAQGKLGDALDLYRQSLKIRQTLADQDKSNSRWQSDLAWSYSKVGDVLVAQGKLRDALDLYRQSLKIRQTLADEDKSNSGWQRDLSVSYEKVADVLRSQGKVQEALDLYRQSLKIRQTLAEQDKSNLGWQRDLSVNYGRVAKMLEAQGKLQDALDAYQKSLTISKRLAEQDKSDSGWQRDLSVGYDEVGDVLRSQGKVQEALDLYRQSLKIRQTLAEQDKSNSGWQRALSVSYHKVGDVLRSQGKFEEALGLYQQDLDIAQRLVQQDPTNVDWQHDLGVSWERIGYVRQDRNDLTGAADAYEQELQIFVKLCGLKPDDAGLEVDYAESKLDVAGVYLHLGKRQSALRLLEEANNSLVDLQKRAPLSTSQQEILDRIEKELSILKQTDN